MKKYLFVLLCLLSLGSVAQNSTEEFTEAKRLYGLSNYQAAKSAFAELTDDEQYAPYASYYFGLSSFYMKDTTAAINMMKQLLNKFPEWEQKSEVLYWLTYLHASKGDMLAAEKSNAMLEMGNPLRELGTKYIEKQLNGLSVSELVQLLKEDNQNRKVAELLAKKISKQKSDDADLTLLDSLIEAYGFDRLQLLDIKLQNEFKNEYAVALVLPFMFTSLDNPVPVIRNSLVMDLYQGMKMAQKDLDKRGIKIKLYLFDTQKSAKETRKYLNELKGMDLVVGPFYPGPVEVISKFSIENKINIINPLSENVDYLESNPLAFLFKPSFLTSAEKLANWVVKNVAHKEAVIYYENNNRDSLFAAAYRSILEKDSFNIVAYRAIDEPTSKVILDSLSEQFEKIYPKDVADSIAKLPGRYIKERRLRKNELKNRDRSYPYYYAENDEKRENKLIAYENKFVIKKDTIGSIMIASKNTPIANNIISAVTTRGDTTRLIGYGDWLEFKSLNFEQMESIGTWFVKPVYIDNRSDFYKDLSKKLMKTYQKVPSEYQLLGYEMLRFMGENLNLYGKYFQLGLCKKGYVPGYLTQGFNFHNSNDNQAVPVVEIQNLKITPINKENYADRK